MTAKAAVFCVYFGPLPSYFPLWRNSLARSSSVDWFLITDQITDTTKSEKNFTAVIMSKSEFSQFMSDRLGISLVLRKPYKVCDWRPAFSCLLEFTPNPELYDFWGHSDMDLIVGDIDSFLSSPGVKNYDRVFDQGHFSLYRNREDVNRLYQSVRSQDWRTVFQSEEHFGFDEHAGINRAFHQSGLRVLKSGIYTADINPAKSHVQLLPPNFPFARHLLYCEPGRVMALSERCGKIKQKEFCFVHFQKRAIKSAGVADRFYFSGDQVTPVEEGWVGSEACLMAIKNSQDFKSLGVFAQLRQWKRYYEIIARDQFDRLTSQVTRRL
jgi:hypothetical protein